MQKRIITHVYICKICEWNSFVAKLIMMQEEGYIMRDIILRTIAEADEEDSKLYVKAAVKRREELLMEEEEMLVIME